MKIIAGIPEAHRARAVDLYWLAFGPKLRVPLGPQQKATAFVTRVLDPTHGICAIDDAGRLMGVVGFKTYRGALVGGGFADLRAIYGVFGATWRAALLSLLERDTENVRFLMDGIFVAPEARGRGVGTALLHAIYDEARKRGFHHIRLDVISTNPRARALYEREGFVATHTARLGMLRHVFGFDAATTMVRKL
ncbi:GNAT family N-acetyltransferase [Yoonia sp. 208BN28-4]|uniref:GNAT family N-acetyltransferase n=1 Tax=Yoonia sp. 208BN28-4 TaxID=3126505 RepID=UPI0030B5731F